MKQHQKHFQFFASVEKQSVQNILGILKTEQATSIGVNRDSSVKIIPSSDPNLKLIPLSFRNPESYRNTISLLKKKTVIEFKVLKLPWDENWAQTTRYRSLHDHLEQVLDHKILNFIPKTYDIIGNLAILDINRWGELSEFIQNPTELSHILSIVGETIINLHSKINTVLNKVGNIEGEFRLREYQIIAGGPSTITAHRENNCIFHVDPTMMFFSPRLSFERNRVSNLKFDKNAIVLDCFAGIGPFSIQIAHNHEVQIYCIEKNPNAYEFLQKNIKLNQKLLKGIINPYLGDFREFFKVSSSQNCIDNTDYIIMNLPERSHEFLPNIVPFVKRDATFLIYYTLVSSSNSLQDAITKFKEDLQGIELDIVGILQKRVVFSHSPIQNIVGIDAIIRKK